MTLFDAEPASLPKVTAREKAARKVTAAVAENLHPLSVATRLPLGFHRDAAPRYAPPTAPGLRCGSCALKSLTRKGWRCQLAPTPSDPDVRLWWPSCIRYQAETSEGTS